MLGLIPIVIAAWGWSRRTALLATVLTLVAHLVFISWFDTLDSVGAMSLSYVAAHGLIALMAGLIGTLFDQYRLLYGDLITARRLNADLEAYTRMVAHDLKNPLASFASGTEHLRMEWQDKLDAVSMELLDSLEQQSHRMLSTVDGLLRLALFERKPVQIVKTNPAFPARRAWEGLSHLRKKQTVEVEWPEQWPEVYCYPAWLEEVWDNLMSNALKYGGTPRKLVISASPEGEDYVRLSVDDNGSGIPSEVRKEIIQKFSGRPKVNVDSCGIGLMIVQRILHRFGSSLEINPTVHFPTGMCFSFRLPVKEELVPAAESATTQRSSTVFQTLVVG